jgi:hypothetical protein
MEFMLDKPENDVELPSVKFSDLIRKKRISDPPGIKICIPL